MEEAETKAQARGDPFEEEAPPWQDKVATLARGGWAGEFQAVFQGVDLVLTVEYFMADHLNRVMVDQ